MKPSILHFKDRYEGRGGYMALFYLKIGPVLESSGIDDKCAAVLHIPVFVHMAAVKHVWGLVDHHIINIFRDYKVSSVKGGEVAALQVFHHDFFGM